MVCSCSFDRLLDAFAAQRVLRGGLGSRLDWRGERTSQQCGRGAGTVLRFLAIWLGLLVGLAGRFRRNRVSSGWFEEQRSG